ncbi:MAG: alpha/beta hydrolase [Solirubrobacterales bacterium]|nr:alpha/beta hydrolase [Solirubrobacterales bacterium]
MARASTGKSRGASSRIGWPLKIIVGVLLVLLVLLVLNAFALNNETKPAEINVPGGQLVNTTSGQLQVLDTGEPPAQASLPVVLIHGSAGAINWWDDLIPLLEPDHRVIAIDMLGYGGSEKPDSDYSIETQGRAIAEVLSRLGVSRAVLVGHSLGGKVVTSVAEQAPALAAGLTVIDTAPDNSFGGLSGGARASRTPLLGQALWRVAPDSMVRKNLEQGFAPGYDVPDKFVEDVREMTYPAYKDSAVQGEEYTEDQTLVERLTALEKPLLVIFGEEDQIYDAREALSAYAAIPGVETRLIVQSGHSPQVEAPEQTANMINTFAASIVAADTARIARARALVRKQQAKKRQARNRVRQQEAKRRNPRNKASQQAGNQQQKQQPQQQGPAQNPGNSGQSSANGASADAKTESGKDWQATP